MKRNLENSATIYIRLSIRTIQWIDGVLSRQHKGGSQDATKSGRSDLIREMIHDHLKNTYPSENPRLSEDSSKMDKIKDLSDQMDVLKKEMSARLQGFRDLEKEVEELQKN